MLFTFVFDNLTLDPNTGNQECQVPGYRPQYAGSCPVERERCWLASEAPQSRPESIETLIINVQSEASVQVT